MSKLDLLKYYSDFMVVVASLTDVPNPLDRFVATFLLHATKTNS